MAALRRVEAIPPSLLDDFRRVLNVENDPESLLLGEEASFAKKDMSFHPTAMPAAVALPVTCVGITTTPTSRSHVVFSSASRQPAVAQYLWSLSCARSRAGLRKLLPL